MIAFSGEVVEPFGEGIAMPYSDCVSSYNIIDIIANLSDFFGFFFLIDFAVNLLVMFSFSYEEKIYIKDSVLTSPVQFSDQEVSLRLPMGFQVNIYWLVWQSFLKTGFGFSCLKVA